MVNLLLDQGAGIQAIDFYGTMALDLAYGNKDGTMALFTRS